MFAHSQSVDYPCSRSPLDRACYTQLQPVSGSCFSIPLGGLITSSTKVCLLNDTGEPCVSSYPPSSSCQIEYHVYPSALHPCSSPPVLSPAAPHSPEKELSDIQEVLQPRMPGSKGDDDDSSVMFDFTDLTFLDQYSRDDSTDSSSSRWQNDALYYHMDDPGYYSSSSYSQENCLHRPHHLPSTVYATNNDNGSAPTTTVGVTSLYNRHRPRPALSQATTTTTTTTPNSTNTLSLHYYDSSTVIQHPIHPPSSFPPTPSPSPSPHQRDVKSCHTSHHHQQQHHHHQHHHQHHAAMTTMPAMNNDEDDDDDAEYKPYCDSRRGAKKNLLWKFLLWVLDHHSDLAQWIDMQKGVFKFVDTARISTLWGQRKHKNDMTFEKLSRGIRHYYKRGLMERMSNTRLVYKFNWDKVPKKHRKA